MNKRLFGFEELTELFLKIDSQLSENIDVEKFIEINFKLLNQNVGIDKKGNSKGHAFSLITKYPNKYVLNFLHVPAIQILLKILLGQSVLSGHYS